MERLTFDDNGCNSIKACENDLCRETCMKVDGCLACPIKRAIDKLSEYEDMEEQGRLVKLPCKVGTEIFRVGEDRRIYDGWLIEHISLFEDEIEFVDDSDNVFYLENIGKTVFLSREDAEQSLNQEQS